MVSVLLTGILITSCDSNLDLTNPSYRTVDSYYETSSELLSATNSIYSVLHSISLAGREWFFIHDLRSDEVKSGGGQLEVKRRQILQGASAPSNVLIADVWEGLYVLIHRANVVVASGPNVTDNEELRDRLVAEAKFLRAWAYFELVSMWGPVPLYTAPVTETDQFKPRAPESEVYAQIILDLQDAAAVLPSSYTGGDLGRVTNGAANAMLGRVYMQQHDYASAKTHLLKVYNDSQYGLLDNYYDNFKSETEFNKETVFCAVFMSKGTDEYNWGGGQVGNGPNSGQTTIRSQEYCPLAWRNLIPSDKYLNNFEIAGTDGATKTDPRLAMSVYMTGDTFNGGTETMTASMQNGNASTFHGETIKASWKKYTLLYKQSYEVASGYNSSGINQRMIRFAEILINLAECEIETNPGNIAGALAYLNEVRARPSVDMPPYPTAQYPANNKMDVIRIIMHEKMAELGGEQLRNIDIKRWREQGYFEEEPISYFTEGRDELLPIPSNEVSNNPELGSGSINAQNPGY